MKLSNTTSIPNEKIREMVRFACPPGVTNFDIQIKNCRAHGWTVGRAYTKGCAYHSTWSPLINVRVPLGEPCRKHTGRENKFGDAIYKTTFEGISYPRKRHGHGGYLPYIVLNQDEEVLAVIAHELRHLWQRKVKKGWRVWGARGQYSERDADAYAIKVLRAFRRSVESQSGFYDGFASLEVCGGQ